MAIIPPLTVLDELLAMDQDATTSPPNSSSDGSNRPNDAKPLVDVTLPTRNENDTDYRSLWRRRGRKQRQTSPTIVVTPSAPASSGSESSEAARTPSKPKRLTPEERVEKHRMIVRRSYYQKKEIKERLREEIATLEAKYEALVAQTADLDRRDAHMVDVLAATPPSSTSLIELRATYRELTIAKEALRREREVLERLLQEQTAFHDKLDLSLRQLERESKPVHDGPDQPIFAEEDKTITIQLSEFDVVFEPFTEDECFEILRAAHAEIRSQTSTEAFFDTGVPIMGWNRKRALGDKTNFSLLKRFPDQTAENLWNQTWQLYTESRHFERLYSGTVNIKFYILQRVNANNVLFCRTLKTEKLKIRNATFFLLSRYQVDGKFYIIFRSIEERVRVDHPRDAILRMFSWLCFTNRTNEDHTRHCETEFGGTVPSPAVADADFWMMEFLSYLLRLENCAIGPVFQVL